MAAPPLKQFSIPVPPASYSSFYSLDPFSLLFHILQFVTTNKHPSICHDNTVSD
nr:hypothetical protein [Vibrio alginolyticus]